MLSKLIECKPPGMNHRANRGLQVIMSQCRVNLGKNMYHSSE